MEDARDPASDPDVFAERVAEKVSALAHAALSHFEVLEVPRTANQTQVRNARDRIAREMHADRARALGMAMLCKDCDAIMVRVNDAHRVLADPTMRHTYEQALDTATRPARRLTPTDEAVIACGKGRDCLRRRDFSGAVAHFSTAVSRAPANPLYRGYLAWAQVWKEGRTPEDLAMSVATLTNACSQLSDHAEFFWFLGQALEVQGEHGQALGAYRAARTLHDVRQHDGAPPRSCAFCHQVDQKTRLAMIRQEGASRGLRAIVEGLQKRITPPSGKQPHRR